MPDIVKKCIKSWEKILFDYEIVKWNEENLPINEFLFMKEAYEMKKYAFVSDQARYWVLKQYGGVFLDCDVEVLKNFDALLYNKVFFGIETHIGGRNVVNPGLIIGAEPENGFIEKVFNKYTQLHFIKSNNKFNLSYTSPNILTDILFEYGFVNKNQEQVLNNEIRIYPSTFFDPINHESIKQELNITDSTYAIHWGAASWIPKSYIYRRFISLVLRKVFGNKIINILRGKK